MLTGCTEKQAPLPHLKPDRQAGLLPFYETHPVEGAYAVLLGDDLMADGLWSEIFPNRKLFSRGIPGDCVADIAPRARQAAAAHPAKLLISAGMNDFDRVALEAPAGHGRLDYEPVAHRVALEIQKLFKDLHRISPETELYWLSLYQLPAMDPDAYPVMARVNWAVSAYAAKTGYFTCLDLSKVLNQGLEEGIFSYTEGRWLNAEGFAQLAGYLAGYLNLPHQLDIRITTFTDAQYQNVRSWCGTRAPGEGRVSGYYLDRLSQFQALPREQGGVVLFGDSLIDFGPWNELLPEFPIHPRGIAGDLLDGFTARVDEVASQNPDAVVLIGGCNNLVKTPERAPEDIWKDYETLLATLRKAMPAVPLFVESILPLSPKDEAEYEGFNARAAVLNGFLADAATQAKYNYRYLDLAFQLRDMKGDLGDEYTTDGCHLTPAAYQIWADQLREALGGLNLKQR